MHAGLYARHKHTGDLLLHDLLLGIVFLLPLIKMEEACG
jgi:hypothetical protein